MVNLLHENLDFEMCLLATIHGVPKHGRWQICEDINACDANYNDCVNSNLHTYHCTIHGISNKNYTEALSHIRVDIGLKNIHYFCVIKYDLPFVDINDVYIEIFLAQIRIGNNYD